MFRGKRLHLGIISVTIIFMLIFHYNFKVVPQQFPARKDISFTFYIYTPQIMELKHGERKITIDKELDKIFEQYQDTSKETLMLSDRTPGEDTEILPAPDDGSTHVSESGRQGNSKVLLSGSNVIKALAGLSWQDKFWLLKILGRCSMDELMQIKSMLGDGVTWEENRAMFIILRKKVSDEEQKKIDALIELYTR